MAKKLFKVTEIAPPRINGKKAKPGDELRLTKAEAMYDLDQGYLVEVTKDGVEQPAGEVPAPEAIQEPVPADPAPKTALKPFARGRS